MGIHLFLLRDENFRIFAMGSIKNTTEKDNLLEWIKIYVLYGPDRPNSSMAFESKDPNISRLRGIFSNMVIKNDIFVTSLLPEHCFQCRIDSTGF